MGLHKMEKWHAHWLGTGQNPIIQRAHGPCGTVSHTDFHEAGFADKKYIKRST